MTMVIGQYENDAGHLSIRDEDSGTDYTGLEVVGSSFADDAAALAAGDTDGWTVEPITRTDIADDDLIALYDDGMVVIVRNPYSGMIVAGYAGRKYLGIRG